MKFSKIPKGNPNLLYNEFKKIEDYGPDEYLFRDKNSISRTSNNTVSLKSARPDLISSKDEDEVPLENQIEMALRPITSPKIKAQKLEKLLEEKGIPLSTKRNRTPTENINEDTVQTSRVIEEVTDPYYNSQAPNEYERKIADGLVLPPINDTNTSQGNKHWKFQEPIKYNIVTPRNPSTNASVISDNTKSQIRLTKHSGMEIPIRSLSQKKILKDLGSPMILTPRDGRDSSKLLNNLSPTRSPWMSRKISLGSLTSGSKKRTTLIRKQYLDEPITMTPVDNIIQSKNVFHMKIATDEAAHLLSAGPPDENLGQLNRALLELNQARLQTKFADADKRALQAPAMKEPTIDYFSQMNKSQVSQSNPRGLTKKKMEISSSDMLAKSDMTGKKKDYYNKWFVPVKFWNVEKDPKVKKMYQHLKQDINFFYNNLNNHGNQNPLETRTRKNMHQINSEVMQDKLKQNLTVRKYKQDLLDNQIRIPICLNVIQEEAN